MCIFPILCVFLYPTYMAISDCCWDRDSYGAERVLKNCKRIWYPPDVDSPNPTVLNFYYWKKICSKRVVRLWFGEIHDPAKVDFEPIHEGADTRRGGPRSNLGLLPAKVITQRSQSQLLDRERNQTQLFEGERNQSNNFCQRDSSIEYLFQSLFCSVESFQICLCSYFLSDRRK